MRPMTPPDLPPSRLSFTRADRELTASLLRSHLERFATVDPPELARWSDQLRTTAVLVEQLGLERERQAVLLKHEPSPRKIKALTAGGAAIAAGASFLFGLAIQRDAALAGYMAGASGITGGLFGVSHLWSSTDRNAHRLDVLQETQVQLNRAMRVGTSLLFQTHEADQQSPLAGWIARNQKDLMLDAEPLWEPDHPMREVAGLDRLGIDRAESIVGFLAVAELTGTLESPFTRGVVSLLQASEPGIKPRTGLSALPASSGMGL